MRDFVYYAPTEVVFGKESEEQVAGLVKKYGGHKVLVHYGGRSAKKSGLLDKIFALLRQGGVDFVELGGVVPNPRLSLVQKGIDLCRKEKVDFILAVGGGSVIDSSKAIACGVPFDGNVWDIYMGKAEPASYLPVASVLTIPAAGSEMSDASVITNEDGDVKVGYSNPMSRPKFAIMNPVRTFTLPPYQTAAGVTDMMMHTMERYFSPEDDMDLTDALAEAVLRSMKENVYKVLADPEDYRARAQIMWGGSVAHNDLTGCGMTGDWATHQPSWARYVLKVNVSRFVRFAVNVMDVPNDFTDPEGTALKGIEAMERFYHSIGMPVNIHELIGRDITDDEIKEMVRKCSREGTLPQGTFKVLYPDDMEAIYRMAR